MDDITCTECGTQYKMSYIKIPVRDKDTLECVDCGTQIFKWNEAKMWLAKKKEDNND